MSKLKKIWNFIWHENSILSWIVNILLAFILVKFIIYPGLGLVLGTSHPLVAVVSGSMEHNAGFDAWWEQNKDLYAKHNITKEQFKEFSFKNGFNVGDIMLLVGSENFQVGDILVYNGNYKDPIIHRVVKIENNKYITKGDHNIPTDPIQPSQENVVGKAVFRIPYLGWIKVIFTKIIGGF